MASKNITLDTHVLVWYVDEPLKGKLSSAALKAIREAEEGGIIYIPAIALMETLDLVEKKRSSISFDELMISIEESVSYRIVPIDAKLLRATIPLKGLDIHDRLILATAILTDSVLVSRDRDFKTRLNVVW
jgi:PIN domain nuclease of toxin-antitoxin system